MNLKGLDLDVIYCQLDIFDVETGDMFIIGIFVYCCYLFYSDGCVCCCLYKEKGVDFFV